jgi:hypothetical protein
MAGASVIVLAWALLYGTSQYTLFSSLGIVLMLTTRLTWPERMARGVPCPELALVLMFWAAATALEFMRRWAVPTQDEFLFCLDSYLGNPGFMVGRLLKCWPAIDIALRLAYLGVPTVIAGAYIVTDRKRELMLALLVSGALGLACFMLFPAYGPKHAFRGWPFIAPVIQHPHLLRLGPGYPNCMPSLHITWALLVLVFTKWKVWAWVYLGAMVVTTLGIGEHYVVDLLAAVPFTWLLVWLSKRLVPQTSEH